MEGGGAAIMMHLSHAVTDGVGAVEMLAHIYDLEREPGRYSAVADSPQDLSPNDLMRQGFGASRARLRAGCSAWCPAPPTWWAKRSVTRLADGQRHRLRNVGCPGDGTRGRPVTGAASACSRRAARRSTSSSATCIARRRRRSLDQRCVPGWPMRRAAGFYHEHEAFPSTHCRWGSGTFDPKRRGPGGNRFAGVESRRADRAAGP